MKKLINTLKHIIIYDICLKCVHYIEPMEETCIDCIHFGLLGTNNHYKEVQYENNTEEKNI